MACKQEISNFKLLLISVTYELCIISVKGQIDTSGAYYPQNPQYTYDPYNLPSPGDRDYRTYTYNSRRYGQYWPNNYNGRGQPGDPRFTGQDVRFTYDRVRNTFRNPMNHPVTCAIFLRTGTLNQSFQVSQEGGDLICKEKRGPTASIGNKTSLLKQNTDKSRVSPLICTMTPTQNHCTDRVQSFWSGLEVPPQCSLGFHTHNLPLMRADSK